MDTIERAGDASSNLFGGRAIKEAQGDKLRKIFRGG